MRSVVPFMCHLCYGGLVVEAAFAIRIQNLEGSVMGDPTVVVGVDQGIAFFVCDFSTFCQADATVHYMENGVLFVKH